METPNKLPGIEPLVADCIRGDRKAQTKLFYKYKEMVYGLGYRFLGPEFDLDDVVQRIFIEVFKSLPSYNGKAAFGTWLYRIGINVCTSRLRKKFRKRKLDIASGFDELDNLAGDRSSGPHTDIEQKELQNKIFDALDCINTKKRIVVVMHDMEGKTLEEIALIIGKPVGTVKSRLFHGREEMKKLLKKYLEPGNG